MMLMKNFQGYKKAVVMANMIDKMLFKIQLRHSVVSFEKYTLQHFPLLGRSKFQSYCISNKN